MSRAYTDLDTLHTATTRKNKHQRENGLMQESRCHVKLICATRSTRGKSALPIRFALARREEITGPPSFGSFQVFPGLPGGGGSLETVVRSTSSYNLRWHGDRIFRARLSAQLLRQPIVPILELMQIYARGLVIERNSSRRG